MIGIKKQTLANHARLLANTGFYALTLDAGYQGVSIGEFCGLKDLY